MFERAVLSFVALALLEFEANLITFASLFRRSTATWRALSTGAAIAFGGSNLKVFQACLVLLCNPIAILTKAFPIDEIFHGLVKEFI